MSEDDDDIGGGTLVMNPEERGPSMPRVPSIADAAPAPPLLPDDIDDEGPGMGTLIMAPQPPSASMPRPLSGSASPFAMTMPARASSPSTPGVAPGTNLLAPGPPVGEATGLLPIGLPGGTAHSPSQPHGSVDAFNQTMVANGGQGGLEPAPTLTIPQPGGFQPLDPNASTRAPDGAPPMFDQPTSLETRSRSPSSRLLGLSIGAGLLVVFFVVGVVVLVKKIGDPGQSASASAVASTSAAPTSPTPSPTAAVAVTASSDVAPTPTGDAKEVAARAGLQKLGEGVQKCVAKTIHVLPGTSRAVPNAFGFLKKGAYDPLINDWSTPFFSCTGFRIDAPMPYAIQWQLDRANDLGTGIAWVDDDADGKPDRAFAFKATLTKRDVVELGPIEQVDASRAMQKR